MQQESGEESLLEEQCWDEINTQNDECERELVRSRDVTLRNVWGAFQDSATAVAQLYRERSSNSYPDTGALWLPFQTAAGTVTTLYKESCEGLKRTTEAATQSGYHKRTRELADWARSKKRRMIRREDLLAYLAGKPLSSLTATYNRRSPKPENASFTHSSASAVYPATMSHPPPLHTHVLTNPSTNVHGGHQQQLNPANESVNDLHTFKEALVLKPRGPELFAFVANEIARHCKRPASPIDDKMEVCHYSSKRPRFM